MKRRVFFQISVIVYVVLLLFLAFIVAGFYILIDFFANKINVASVHDWLVVPVGLFTIVFIGYFFIRVVRNRIIFEETEIFVPENWGSADYKIQYETHVPYSDITNIFMVYTSKNSLNKTARWVFAPMPYIVFDCKNDKQMAVNVFYYSKKQIAKIIDETVIRAKLLGNDINIKSGKEMFKELQDRENKEFKKSFRKMFKRKKK